MSKKGASQAKIERFELFGNPEQFDALFSRKNESIFAQNWSEKREKVRAILSEVHAKIVGAFKKRMCLKVAQHKGFSNVGAEEIWKIFAKSRVKISRNFAQKCAKN
jgi:hypothetical protein